jgi:beta-phosphoglucomutase-like phosphatase (HAD superfamily)
VQAGLAAGCQVVWIPDASLRATLNVDAVGATVVLGSLEAFKPEDWGFPAYDA